MFRSVNAVVGRQVTSRRSVLEGHGYLNEKDLAPGRGSGLQMPDPSLLPPGTSVTATLRVERLTDDEIVEMKRLLLKLGVEELPSGPRE